MNTKDIEEMVWEIAEEASNLTDGAGTTEEVQKVARRILTTLTQHHQAEVERAVEERCKREHLPELVHDYRTKEQYEIFIKRRQEQIEYLEGLIEEAIIRKQALTPTKTDEQTEI